MKNSRHKLWLYTILVLLLKYIIFLGFTIDTNHLSIDFYNAFGQSLPKLPFYFGFTGVFLSFAFLLKNRRRLWFLFCFNLFVSTLLLIDIWYFRGFNTMPSLHLLMQTTNLDNLSGSILSMIHPIDFIFVLDIPVLLGIIIRLKPLYLREERKKILFAAVFMLSMTVLIYIPVGKFFGHKDEKAVFSLFDASITSYNLSPLGYHLMNVYSFWKDSQPLKLTQPQREEIQKWYEEKAENLPPNKYKSLLKGKNLVIIQVESLENFVLTKKVNGQEIAPNLNGMLKNSLFFSNIYEQINLGTTSDAELMTNTSVYPLRQGSTFFSYPYTTYNSLPLLLKNQGYSTLAIHSDKGSYWNWMTALSSIGFEKCLDYYFFEQDEYIGMGLSDGSYLRQVEPALVKLKQPFYTFIVTLSSHAPYDLPKQHRELAMDEALDKSPLGGYFQSVHYVDKHIGRFVESLEKDRLLDNTVIVVTGDHEGIHKYYSGQIKKLPKTEDWWLNNGKHVPFIVYSKGLHGEEISVTGGQVDYLPTLGYLLGIDEKDYANTAMGRNLLNTKKNFAILRYGEYVGDKSSSADVAAASNALELADSMIKSNYFKEK